MQMIYSNTLKTPALVGIEEMLHVGKQAFQFNFETCSSEQTTNCPAQTAVLRDDTGIFKVTNHRVIRISRNTLRCCKKKKAPRWHGPKYCQTPSPTTATKIFKL